MRAKPRHFLKKDHFPKFVLHYRKNGQRLQHYTSNLKSRIVALLNREAKITEASFSVVYSERDDLRNDSVWYSLPNDRAQLKRDWSIFTSETELDSCLKEAHDCI